MQVDELAASQRLHAVSRWLFASLLISLLVLPSFEGWYDGRKLSLIGQTLALVAAAAVTHRTTRVLSLSLLVVALPTCWANIFVDSSQLFAIHCLIGSGFFWLVGIVIVYLVIRTFEVTLDTIFAAMSAYLLFGLAWALSYWAIDTLYPDSFPDHFVAAQNDEPPNFSHFVYFSFVTMSTLGYGDITPQDQLTRTLAWVQSVTGQFYVAVLIAWLVSALPRPGDRYRRSNE